MSKGTLTKVFAVSIFVLFKQLDYIFVKYLSGAFCDVYCFILSPSRHCDYSKLKNQSVHGMCQSNTFQRP